MLSQAAPRACRATHKAAFAPHKSTGARLYGVMGARPFGVMQPRIHTIAQRRRNPCTLAKRVGNANALLNMTGTGKGLQSRSLQTRALAARAEAGGPSEQLTAGEGPVSSEGLTELESYVLNFDLSFTDKMLKVVKYFGKQPARSAVRLAEVIGVATRIIALWTWEERRRTPEDKRQRAEVLRNGIAQLGPVFVKLAQTLSTRPDIIGEEAADSLLVLQDQMGPFDSKMAMDIIREEMNWEGPLVLDSSLPPSAHPPLFRSLSAAPIAAASIGQVYKGVIMDTGAEVAVKVQRPGSVDRIALDMFIARQALDWLEKSGYNGSEDLPIIVDEVGAAIFYELDYRQEGKNADDFARSLKMLNFIHIPETLWPYTRRRVLVQEWINGRPMKQLTLEEQRKMVQMGVECSATQLLRTGLVHADPHEGNMMYTDAGRLALIDFGLVCRVDDDRQEAMASCILNILNANWGGVVDNLRVIGILPPVAAAWTNAQGQRIAFEAGTAGEWVELNDQDFKTEFSRAMSAGKGGDAKKNFTELVMDLTQLAGMYRFCLPPYMVFIIRSVTTLDFCAVRTNCNMYELAAPVAIWRALTPKTETGRLALKKALLTDSNEINWARLQELSDNRTAKRADGTVDGSMDEEDPEQSAQDIVGLLKKLLVMPEGAALRRVAFQAAPSGLLPPPSMRQEIIDQLHTKAQAAFKARIRSFSPRKIMKAAIMELKAMLNKSKAQSYGAKRGMKGQVKGGVTGLSVSAVRLKQRQRAVVGVLLRNKVGSRAGLLTLLQVLLLAMRVCMSVLVAVAVDSLVYGARRFFAVLARSFSRPPSAVPPPPLTNAALNHNLAPASA